MRRCLDEPLPTLRLEDLLEDVDRQVLRKNAVNRTKPLTSWTTTHEKQVVSADEGDLAEWRERKFCGRKHVVEVQRLEDRPGRQVQLTERTGRPVDLAGHGLRGAREPSIGRKSASRLTATNVVFWCSSSRLIGTTMRSPVRGAGLLRRSSICRLCIASS